MKPWYAIGARTLLDLRLSGQKPAVPVQVALNDEPAAIVVKPDMPAQRLDWRMLADCEVWVWSDESVPLPRLLSILDGIAECRPAKLILRFVRGDEVHDVEVGAGMHLPPVIDLPAVHRFTWCAINLTGSRPGAMLRRALLQHRPAETVL